MNVKFDGGGNFYSFKIPKKLCGRTGGLARTYTVLSTCFCTSNTIFFVLNVHLIIPMCGMIQMGGFSTGPKGLGPGRSTGWVAQMQGSERNWDLSWGATQLVSA